MLFLFIGELNLVGWPVIVARRETESSLKTIKFKTLQGDKKKNKAFWVERCLPSLEWYLRLLLYKRPWFPRKEGLREIKDAHGASTPEAFWFVLQKMTCSQWMCRFPLGSLCVHITQPWPFFTRLCHKRAGHRCNVGQRHGSNNDDRMLVQARRWNASSIFWQVMTFPRCWRTQRFIKSQVNKYKRGCWTLPQQRQQYIHIYSNIFSILTSDSFVPVIRQNTSRLYVLLVGWVLTANAQGFKWNWAETASSSRARLFCSASELCSHVSERTELKRKRLLVSGNSISNWSRCDDGLKRFLISLWCSLRSDSKRPCPFNLHWALLQHHQLVSYPHPGSGC